ncbi:MAG: glycosyltransferase family 39 protein, partial [Chloroflexi bacterium]|nr:glycosyltransferase family 39 protein [Chloroflexota bacterium]
AGFPVNDGGMFYTMMKDLLASRYIPPLYTSYNQLDIPFAYPPLGLYLGAGLNELTGISLISVLQWLPAVVHTACIPALYYLARELTGDKLTSAAAALAFALTPHLNAWLSAGGGLTRSLGALFLILTILFSYRLLANNDTRAIGWTVLFGSLTVLSHTEATVFAIALPIYIWIAKSRSRKSALQGGWVALGVLICAGPWYGFIVHRHGIEPLLSALRTGGQTFWSPLRLINIELMTEEPYLDLLGVFGVLGMAVLLIRREYFLPILLAAIYLVQPRSAHTVGNVPLSIAAGVFFTQVLEPAVKRLDKNAGGRAVGALCAVLIPYLLANSIYQGFLLSQNKVPPGEQAAMQWIKESAPPESRFLVLTGEPDAMCDSSAEWFPALTDRASLTTPQGGEWLNGQFGESLARRAALQACLNQGVECLEREAEYWKVVFDYVYIPLQRRTVRCKTLETDGFTTPALALALENSPNYNLVYRTKNAVLFEKK